MIQSTRWLVSQYNAVIVFVLVFPLIYSFPQSTQTDFIQSRELRSQKFRACGRNLMDLIQLVCSGSAAPGKRSNHDKAWTTTAKDNAPWSQDTQLTKLNLQENSDSSSDSNDFVEPKAAFSLLGTNKRSKIEESQIFFRSLRGATDECCYNSCSLSVLQTYCYRPSSGR